MTFAQNILRFNSTIDLDNRLLPENIKAMNPFRGENAEVIQQITTRFYLKYYNDNTPRHAILGINPGRFGAGATGIPFTDTKRLTAKCHIKIDSFTTHEPSSVFVYEVIDAYGSVAGFYSRFFITSLSPLGFVKQKDNKREVNSNFYDDKDLEQIVTPFIIKSIETQIAFGIKTDKVFLLGTGKNYQYLKKLNAEYQFFDKIIPLEHPRYVMQYKYKNRRFYVEKYIKLLSDR